MIERLFKNELKQKRLRRFLKVRRAVLSLAVVGVMLGLSLTAEFWANSKPLVMVYDGGVYAPALRTYHPSRFGQDGFVTDYRKLDWSKGWAVWPPVHWDPYESNQALAAYPGKPSFSNWLGTDDRGRDVLSRLLYGFRYSVGFAVVVWLATYFVGTVAGAAMGFFGGRVDLFGQRVIEVLDSLPYVLMLLTLIAFLGSSMCVLVVFTSLLGWMGISIYMRAEFLKLRRRDFVESARAQGLGVARILGRHILPNALGPLITFSPTQIASNIGLLATLDYLGMGLPPPTPSWGELLAQSQNYFTLAWWLAVYPSLAMILALTSLTFIGEGIREAFDPRVGLD